MPPVQLDAASLRMAIDIAVVGLAWVLFRYERRPDLAALDGRVGRLETLRDEIRLLVAQAEGHAIDLDRRLGVHGDRIAGLLASAAGGMGQRRSAPAEDGDWQAGLVSRSAGTRAVAATEAGAEPEAVPAELELRRALDRARAAAGGGPS